MKIFITGISGFVARHFLDYLTSLPHEFEVEGTYHVHKPEFSPTDYPNLKLRLLQMNLTNRDALNAALTYFRPEAILHLAAKSSVGYSWENPAGSILENTSIYLNLLECVRLNKIPCRILSIGSAEEYGTVSEADLPIREDHCLNPSNPYGAHRSLQHYLSGIYSRSYGLDIIHTRSFNHTGPYQLERFVLASFAKQIATQIKKGSQEINIQVGDLDIVRDFTDVRDVVKAYYGLLMKGMKGETYNVCSNRGYLLRDMVGHFENIIQRKINCIPTEHVMRPFENRKLIGSYEKINLAIGWKPEIEIEKTLADLLNQ